ncbi:MAG: hypothetical protein Fur005_48040 [Roseiflexaceae bacterium]
MSTPQIDPELAYLLEQSNGTDIIEVALLLKADINDPQVLLDRVDAAAHADLHTSYMANVRVLTVRGPVIVIRSLAEQPEVELASAVAVDE